jgi:hypothetical protein
MDKLSFIDVLDVAGALLVIVTLALVIFVTLYRGWPRLQKTRCAKAFIVVFFAKIISAAWLLTYFLVGYTRYGEHLGDHWVYINRVFICALILAYVADVKRQR